MYILVSLSEQCMFVIPFFQLFCSIHCNNVSIMGKWNWEYSFLHSTPISTHTGHFNFVGIFSFLVWVKKIYSLYAIKYVNLFWGYKKRYYQIHFHKRKRKISQPDKNLWQIENIYRMLMFFFQVIFMFGHDELGSNMDWNPTEW